MREYGISKQDKGISCESFTPDHLYECRATDSEAEDLTCTDCYPIGEDGHYNCSCWTSLEPELLEPVYSSCKDALDMGNTESGVYAIKPDNLAAFKVMIEHAH